MSLDARAVHRAVAAWGRTPTSVTHFEDPLTLFDDRGESRRFLLLRDLGSEIAVAREPSLPTVRQATVTCGASAASGRTRRWRLDPSAAP